MKLAGLTTMVQPAASAGAHLRVIMAFGKFQGVIAAHTPTGCLSTIRRRLLGDGRDDVAVDALGLLGEPLEEGGAVGDLAARLGQRLALLAGHQEREVLLVGHHQVEPLAQDRRALLGGRSCASPERPLGRLDRAPGLGDAHARHGADDLAVGRIGDLDRRAVVGVDPGAVDVALLAEQARVGELDAEILERGRHAGSLRCSMPCARTRSCRRRHATQPHLRKALRAC